MNDLGVLYYVGSFPKLSESFVLNELAELKDRGHNVAVFAQNNPDEDIQHQEYNNLDIPVYYAEATKEELPQLLSTTSVRIAAENLNPKYISSFSVKDHCKSLLLAKQCCEYIQNLDFQIDIINIHFASPSRMGAIHASNHLNIPSIVTPHAVHIFQDPNIGQIQNICGSANSVVVPSEYNHEYLRNQIGITNDIHVVPATTDIEKFDVSGPAVENRILSVARLVEKKGIKYAIEAVSQLVEKGFDIEYHIIGSGPREQFLKTLSEKKGVSDHMKFVGNVSDKRLKQELRQASVFVLPCVIAENGDRDAMPVVLKEAMASETACVSTTVSAVPELITDEEDGLLVPPRDPENLSEAIAELIDSPDMRDDIAQKGKRTVTSEFDITDSVDSLLEVFEKHV